MTKKFVIELFHEPKEKRYFEDDLFIPAVTSPTLEDRLMAFYTAKLNSIAGQYQEGGLEWIMQAMPEFYRSLCQADDRVNEVWKLVLAGVATVAEFEAAVLAWYQLQLQGIQLYKATLPKPDNKPVVRQTIPVCPCCHDHRWWISVYGVRVCAICHPPAKEKLVKEWINQKGESC